MAALEDASCLQLISFWDRHYKSSSNGLILILRAIDARRRASLWQGHVSFLQGRSEIIDLSMDSERPANLNSDVPVPLSTKNVPKITCHRGTGHRSI